MNSQNLMEAANVSLDDNGDQLFFKTLVPFMSLLPPEDRLEYRKQLTDLVKKYAFPGTKHMQSIKIEKGIYCTIIYFCIKL